MRELNMVSTSVRDRVPGGVVAAAAAVAAIYAPNRWLKGFLAGLAVTFGALAVSDRPNPGPRTGTGGAEEPHWRTLKTYRVQA